MATRRQSKRAAARRNPAPEAPAVAATPSGADAAAAASPSAANPPAAAAASVAVTRLAGALSIRSVGQTIGELRGALGSGTLRLDAGAVEQVDTAGLQLLVSALATASARGMAFEWVGVSATLRDAAAFLGLTDALRLPAAA
jgi:ABC-type transporter Mla MlaB component